jgi:hypothetical protein
MGFMRIGVSVSLAYKRGTRTDQMFLLPDGMVSLYTRGWVAD